MSYFNLSLTSRLVLASLSGLLALPATGLAEFLTYHLPIFDDGWTYILVGSIFGALVLVPFIAADRGKLGKIVGLIVSSILIYTAAVYLVFQDYSPFSGPDFLFELLVSGTLGALLVTLSVVIIAPIKASLSLWLYTTAAGFSGGFAFFGLFDAAEWVSYFAYVPWQLLVFAALYAGTHARNDI